MITITVQCPYCGSDRLVRNGRAPNGKQKYLCRACQRLGRAQPSQHAYPSAAVCAGSNGPVRCHAIP